MAYVAVAGGDGNSGAAYTACKRAATATLANPASADFEVSAISIEKVSRGYRISGPLKAANAFGVVSEHRFECTATSSGSVLDVEVR